MTQKISTLIVIMCLVTIASYHIVKYTRAESQSRERQLAFQKEKEETRKAEFAKLLEIREKEKRESAEKEAMKSFIESQDRQMDLVMQAISNINQARNHVFDPLFSSKDKDMVLIMESDIGKGTNDSLRPANPYLGGNPLSSSSTPKTSKQGRISCISGTKANKCVLIGDELFHESDTFNGVKIVNINNDEVVFEKDGKQWTQGVGELILKYDN